MLTDTERTRWDELLAEKSSVEGDLERVENCQRMILERVLTRVLLDACWRYDASLEGLCLDDKLVELSLLLLLQQTFGLSQPLYLREEKADSLLLLTYSPRGISIEPWYTLPARGIILAVSVDVREWAEARLPNIASA